MIAALTTLALLAAMAPSASAKVNVAVGIGDQSEAIFGAPSFTGLKVKKLRYFIKWDAIDRPGELAQADRYVNTAKAFGLDVLMHISTNNLTLRRAKLPTVKAYSGKVRQLIARYRPQGVETWGAFNEANHASQPTYRNPRRAAQFFLRLRKDCRGCKIVALDVLDQAGVERYIRRFYRALGRKRGLAKVVGIHNYSDTNRYRSTGTRSIIRTVKRYNRRAQFWLTETGGVIKFGRSFPCNPRSRKSVRRAEARQRRAIRYMFRLTRQFRRDIDRLYIYNYSGADCRGRFDAGLTRRNGKPRPAYHEVRRQLRSFRR